MIDLIKKELATIANKKKALEVAKYFKTSKGEYGEGDVFIGITVPAQRIIVKKYYKDISLAETIELLHSPIHEHRSVALMILDWKYSKASEKLRKQIMNLYVKNLAFVNNWDLVDSSARYILGAYLFEYKKDKKILYTLVKSTHLWKRRVAIIASHYFILHDDFKDTLHLAEILLSDKHDLMHKAVGWMLREVGKRNREVLVQFLTTHAHYMPRTTLRYALEHFDPKKRSYFMKLKKPNLTPDGISTLS